MKVNVKAKDFLLERLREAPRTHEGGFGREESSSERLLLRQASCCLLFENTYYQTGDEIFLEILASARKVSLPFLAKTAIYLRKDLSLRHVPLFLLAVMNQRRGELVGRELRGLLRETVPLVVSRADEMGELLALCCKVEGLGAGKVKDILGNALRRGLGDVFGKFNEYQLAKYDRAEAVRLRDVLRLCHPKPKDKEQSLMWKALKEGSLPTPDTWEVALSGGADKKETFERLLREKKLGGLAFLRNLRNMLEARVEPALLRERFLAPFPGVLPYQFISAGRAAPSIEPELERAALRTVEELPRLNGSTGILVDVSGSMQEYLSSGPRWKAPDLAPTRMDAASGLAFLLAELCSDGLRVATFSREVVEVPPRRGFALRDAILNSQPHRATYLQKAVTSLQKNGWDKLDRLIVITDEQSHEQRTLGPICKRNYLMNVAPYKVGVALQNGWTLVNGFSERLVDFLRESEK